VSLRDELRAYIVNQEYRVALYRGDLELKAAGYERQAAPIKADRVEGVVTFGPFERMTRFDSIWLVDGDRQIEELHTFSEPLAFPPGSLFEHDLGLDVL
jgi:hypothetical protein